MEIHNINENNSCSDRLELNENYYGEYYSYEDVLNECPDFNKAHFGRKVLQKYTFAETDYKYIIFSPNKKEKYKFYDETYCKAKLFFKKQWVEDFLFKTNRDYIDLPPLLKIKDLPDVFKNGENSLKFRGEKTREKLLVSVDSVAKLLEINPKILRQKLIGNNYALEKNKHYISCGYKNNENKIIKVLYFTYNGFIAYMFISKSHNALKIFNYFETILFTSMFGSSEEKTEMVLKDIIKTPEEVSVFKKKLGVPISESKQITTIYGPISCLYLLIFEEREETYVVKFGKSKDLKTRLEDHKKTYGDVSIKFCRYIDAEELSSAEKELHTFFEKNYTPIKKWPISNNTVRKEVFEIKKGELKDVKKFYDELTAKFGKKVGVINKNMKASEKNKKQEIEKIKHFYELKIKDIENSHKISDMEKDCEIKTLKKDIEQQKKSYEKDIENLNLKLEMVSFKLSIYAK